MEYQKLITNGIKQLRIKLGLTQEQFSEKAGLTPQGLSNLERNKYQPTAETIDLICKNFNVHPVDLLLDYPDAMETEDLLKQINVVLKQFSKEELQKLYKILTVLKNLE